MSYLDNCNWFTLVQFQVKTNKEEYLEKMSEIKQNFDAFEKHLYTVSGSLQYPKSGTSNIKLTDTGSILNPTGSGEQIGITQFVTSAR